MHLIRRHLLTTAAAALVSPAATPLSAFGLDAAHFGVRPSTADDQSRVLQRGAKRGAILGMEWHKAVTGDLALASGERYPQLRISGNRVS